MYEHLKNAGNVFDVFKHGVLMKAVESKPPLVYFESHCGFASYEKPELWESSWIKVQRESNCHCFLCDTNCNIHLSVLEACKEIGPYFTFFCADGFEVSDNYARQEVPPDLFFVDPPYKDDSDWKRVMDLTTTFNEVKAEWILWYPIFANGLTFKPEVPAIEMYWTTKENLHGCGMAICGDFDMNEIRNCLSFLQWCVSAKEVKIYD